MVRKPPDIHTASLLDWKIPDLFSGTVVDRIMPPLLKDIHTQNSQQKGQRDFADVTELRILRCEDCPGPSGWAQEDHKGPGKREAEGAITTRAEVGWCSSRAEESQKPQGSLCKLEQARKQTPAQSLRKAYSPVAP